MPARAAAGARTPEVQTNGVVRLLTAPFRWLRAHVRAKIVSGALAFGLAVCALFGRAGVAHDRQIAQLSLPTTAPATGSEYIVQKGLYLTAPIVIDGNTVFRVAAPIGSNATQLPIGERVTLVQTALGELVAESGTGADAATIFDPRTLRIHARSVGDAVVLEAVDAKHTDPLPIVTVTANDARANAVSVGALGGEWQAILQSAVIGALVRRQPAVERRSLESVLRVAGVLVAVSIGAYVFLRSLWAPMAELEAQITQTAATGWADASEGESAGGQRRRAFAVRLRSLKPAQRLGLYGAVAETTLWAVALAWLVAATWSLSLFAQTTPLSQTIAHDAISIAAIGVFAVLLTRALDALIVRSAGAWRIRRVANSDDRARALLRIPTISRAIGGAKNFAIVFIAVLSVLGQIGVPIGSVITIGGLTAIALSLAAQNFVRDFLNGFLVLLEDQYVVGDYVTINTFSGSVEQLTLRMVQIRDASGNVVTIPHSSVTNVVNQSRNWSRIDFRIPIDPNADVIRAMQIIREQITDLRSESDWTYGVDDPIEWIGIDAVSRDWAILRASVRTAPLAQFALRRQLNERVLAAFSVGGIALGAQLPV